MFTGIFHLPWWGYALYALALTHITIVAVTIYLHRCQTHRALDLHPVPSHFFRFWLWLTTGMITKNWVAIHRKHHAKCETVDDPHSPQVEGINKVLWEGAELYRQESRRPETMEVYGHGTPDDWLEHQVYSHDRIGIGTMLAINFILFGFAGIAVWAVQMLWIPMFAAGVINGIGHYWGYRTFQPEDASRNIVPWGILVGGEELHNNHHAYASSARFSKRWYELDIGWLYIRALQVLGLAEVKKVASPIRLDDTKTHCDAATVHAVITHRYEVLSRYASSLRQTCADEIRQLKARAVSVDWAAVRRLLHSGEAALPAGEKEKMSEALSKSKVLDTVYKMREELATLWQRSNATKEQLVRQLEDWCSRAESSGIAALKEFSRRLRRYS